MKKEDLLRSYKIQEVYITIGRATIVLVHLASISIALPTLELKIKFIQRV